MDNSMNRMILFSMLLLIVAGCTTGSSVMDTQGRKSTYVDLGSPDETAGVGIESQDIAGMTDKMMRDMLSNPQLAGRSTPPKVIIDDTYFKNESSSRINKSLITERLMINLNRAANGRLVFVERQAAGMVEEERTLKRQGVVSEGTTRSTHMTAGADFRLTGSIKDLTSINNKTGLTAKYTQISFKMVDLEAGTLVWSGMYEFKKAGQDDVSYR
jgi:PBP1b-binding outer membrane lipoprotein LpoB